MKSIKTMVLTVAVTSCIAAIMLSGCGGEKTDKTTQGNITKNKYINIGQIVSSTGVSGEISKNVAFGVKAAVDEINSDDGVSVDGAKYKFRLMTADDKENKDLAGNAYNNLKDKKIKALISPVSEESLKAIEETVNKDNVPMIIPNISSDDTGKYDNEYRITMSDSQMGKKAAKYAYEELGMRRAVTFTEDKYAKVTEAFINEFQTLGGTVVTNNTYSDAAGITSEALEDLVVAHPDIIFIPDDAANAGDHLDILNSAGTGSCVMGINSWYNINAEQGKYTGLGSIYYICENKEDVLFEADYNTQNAVSDRLQAEYGYDAVYIIKAAIEEAGAIDEDLIIAAMSMIDVDGYTGENITYKEGCNNSKEVSFRTLQYVAGENNNE